MGNFGSYEEEAYCLQNFWPHEHDHCGVDFRTLGQELEDLLMFRTHQLLCSSTSTTQNFFFEGTKNLCTRAPASSDTTNFVDFKGLYISVADEPDALFHGDISSFWPDLKQGAHHKGEKELKQELGGDAAEKKHEGSEETLFSSICTSTTTAQSCLSQDLEGDHHKGEKNLKQDGGRGAGKKRRNVPEEKPLLTFELLSLYYCMPIKQAAEVLNVGLTHLKRRCREFGIPRWPHRQVKSLERLIKNVQELGSDTEEQGEKTKIVERLQRAKKLIEESPAGVELDHRTKVLRQAYFKENYKRRRLMAMEG